jgi:hypothetical protein
LTDFVRRRDPSVSSAALEVVELFGQGTRQLLRPVKCEDRAGSTNVAVLLLVVNVLEDHY